MRQKLTNEAPHLAKEWMTEKNDRPIDEITAGAKYKAWWQCKSCKNQWQTQVGNRTRGSGCPKCVGQHGMPLLEKSPHLAGEWVIEKNGRPINEITSGSPYKAWWQCKACANQWQAIARDRIRGSGCPKCAGKHGIPLSKKSPHLTEEWMTEKNEKPIDKITAGSHYKAWWQCKSCDNQWQASVYHRTRVRKSSGCPKCARIVKKPQ